MLVFYSHCTGWNQSISCSLSIQLTDVTSACVCPHRDCSSHDLRDQPGHGHVLGDVSVDGHGDHGKQQGASGVISVAAHYLEPSWTHC